jgi:hypothetical protein
MKEIYLKNIASELDIKVWQVENCVTLFMEGNTIPFISRYRKERTGGLDDVQVAQIKHLTDVFDEMEKRKSSIISTITSLGKMTAELQSAIDNCLINSELEDLYLPYKPKRRTRATIAKEAGLEAFADKIYNIKSDNPYIEAKKFINEKVPTVDDVINGVCDIIAEKFSETASVRGTLRQIFRTRRIQSKVTSSASSLPEAQKYKEYFDYSEPLSRIASHRLLAILRGQTEGFLIVKIDSDAQKCGNKLYYDFCQEHKYPSKPIGDIIRRAIDDAYSRLLLPSITNEIIKEFKEKADIESINVFGENLKQLLLAPPVGQKRTMAIDPGFRNGCKIVCLDDNGKLLYNEIIYPHPPVNEKIKSIAAVERMLKDYQIQAIAIGNGTASRETESFIHMINLPLGCKVFVVSEDGASIYSASEAARQEFPDEDVTVRGAVSIGRRLMDPLAELVKIDPKSLGIGQYQYDVDQKLLKEKLDNTVISCVNAVGVNLNTSSTYLLQYVSGIGAALASSIVQYRTSNGGFSSKKELLKVPRLGTKVFEQCAGFLRIAGAVNPLDNSAVHPECYHIVKKMASDLCVDTGQLVGNSELCAKIVPEKYVEGDFGIPTINDIIKELSKPGLDPREEAVEFSFAENIHSIDDLYENMEIPGIVTNITAFGAFVDIGVHINGLIHVSQMKGHHLRLHQHITVMVIGIDLQRNRISLRFVK